MLQTKAIQLKSLVTVVANQKKASDVWEALPFWKRLFTKKPVATFSYNDVHSIAQSLISEINLTHGVYTSSEALGVRFCQSYLKVCYRADCGGITYCQAAEIDIPTGKVTFREWPFLGKYTHGFAKASHKEEFNSLVELVAELLK